MTDTYNTGKPCRNGHLAPRYVIGGRCVQCKSEKDARHYARHGDATRARAAKWYADNLEEATATRRAYHQRMKGIESYEAPRRAHHEANREIYNQRKRAKGATPERKAERAAKRKEEAHKYRGYEQKRRARFLRAVPKWYGELDEFVMKEAAELCALREHTTGVTWDMDHMIPMLARKASGLHCASNIQVIPTLLNRRKNNRMLLTEPLEWLRQL